MDLEQLRRQAKQLVRAARKGESQALSRLGSLPTQLASALLVIAREQGFTSWPALVHAAKPDYDSLVDKLGGECWESAFEALMAAGSTASDAICGGLSHVDPNVRRRCLAIADHHLEERMLPLVIANLAHRDGRVRATALHALACDACKEGECRPREDDVVPLVLRFLRKDRSRRVRTGAVSLLGHYAPLRADVALALERARDHDVHPVVREVAGWYAPGGYNYAKRARELLLLDA